MNDSLEDVATRCCQSELITAKVANVPFVLPTPENHYIHVSSERHIKELSEAPEDRLSLHALAKDVSLGSLLHTVNRP